MGNVLYKFKVKDLVNIVPRILVLILSYNNVSVNSFKMLMLVKKHIIDEHNLNIKYCKSHIFPIQYKNGGYFLLPFLAPVTQRR